MIPSDSSTPGQTDFLVLGSDLQSASLPVRTSERGSHWRCQGAVTPGPWEAPIFGATSDMLDRLIIFDPKQARRTRIDSPKASKRPRQHCRITCEVLQGASRPPEPPVPPGHSDATLERRDECRSSGQFSRVIESKPFRVKLRQRLLFILCIDATGSAGML